MTDYELQADEMVVSSGNDYSFRRLKKLVGRTLLLELFRDSSKIYWMRHFVVKKEFRKALDMIRGISEKPQLRPDMFERMEDLTDYRKKRRKAVAEQPGIF